MYEILFLTELLEKYVNKIETNTLEESKNKYIMIGIIESINKIVDKNI